VYCTAKQFQCQQLFARFFVLLVVGVVLFACMYYALIGSFRQALFAALHIFTIDLVSGPLLNGLDHCLRGWQIMVA
jgi:hypothetical protein